MDLRKKTVVVTGGGRGIGRAVALSLASLGADIALFDLNRPDLDQTRALCEQQSVRAQAYELNVAEEDAVSQAMSRVVQDFGRLDGLVNNAGILRDALLIKVENGQVVKRMTAAEWNAVIGVNLTGVFLCGREAAAHMVTLGHGGVIVNVSSISRAGNAGQSNYSAAKAGVAAMSVVWARELARYGIRVGTIAPGLTRTEILDAMRPEVLEKLTAPVPLKRLGKTDEIAHAVRFIFENEFFTGRCIDLDGGLRL
jgi:3-oxoacyl-[acyl-carrier protein] reductase